MERWETFLPWVRRILRAESIEDRSPGVDDLLKPSIKTFQGAVPETDFQWRRLRVAMAGETQKLRAHRATRRTVRLQAALAAAAVLAVVFVAGVFWLHRPSSEFYGTMRGQRSTITLSDSTEVTLNHTSGLTVQSWWRGSPRNVSLNGEAFFRVRRTGAPFTVSTGIATVHVLGTEFNVRARGERLEVGVVSGIVKVSVSRQDRDSSVTLSAGELVSCRMGEYPGTPVPLHASDFPGWIQGKLAFYRTTLASVCRELELQFDVSIGIENPTLGDETITGTIDGRSVESALSTLAGLTGRKYRHEKNGFTLY